MISTRLIPLRFNRAVTLLRILYMEHKNIVLIKGKHGSLWFYGLSSEWLPSTKDYCNCTFRNQKAAVRTRVLGPIIPKIILPQQEQDVMLLSVKARWLMYVSPYKISTSATNWLSQFCAVLMRIDSMRC